ncbi:HECA2 protein, partial [Amia calva]|nr:HECA2 protein [Amia calva]
MHMEYTNKFSFHPPNASLKINRLDDTEEGEYELTINIRFSNDAQPVKKTKSIKVTVDVPVSRPLIRLTPATAAIEDKDNVTLSCWVQNGTRVQYRWLRETNPLQPGARHTLSDGHSVLRISPVRKADMGNYTCEASNYISRQQSQKLPLNVFYGPYNLAVNSDIGLQTGQVFTVDPGELVSFDCWADSNPPNTYVWISKGINFTEVIMTGPRFEVKSLTLAHREDYTCRAYNNVTQKQDEAQFTIVVAGLGIGREKHSQVGSSISPVAAITVTSLIVITCMVFVLFRKACHPQKGRKYLSKKYYVL